MNLPGVDVSAPSITEKDSADVHFAVEQELDYLALSFVRRAAGHRQLRAMIPQGHAHRREDREGCRRSQNIESIIHASDGVMVARGDLGVELPFEEVPVAQKEHHRAGEQPRPPGDHGDADARVDDRAIRVRRAPRRATSRTRFSTARMR